MRALAVIIIALVLCGCAARTPPGVRPVAAGDSRADGIVTMASTGTIWNPVQADWRSAQAAADRRCRGWGHAGAGSFAGWQEACLVYDFHGRCVQAKVTRFYPCAG